MEQWGDRGLEQQLHFNRGDRRVGSCGLHRRRLRRLRRLWLGLPFFFLRPTVWCGRRSLGVLLDHGGYRRRLQRKTVRSEVSIGRGRQRCGGALTSKGLGAISTHSWVGLLQGLAAAPDDVATSRLAAVASEAVGRGVMRLGLRADERPAASLAVLGGVVGDR